MPTDLSSQAITEVYTAEEQGTLSLSDAKPFLKRCFAAAYPTFATPGMLAYVEDVQTADIIADEVEDRVLVVARIQGKLAGMGVGVLRHRTFYVWGFYVDPAKQRCGVGRRIMEELCRDLADDVLIEVQVYTQSHDAVAFYTALGLTTTGQTKSELFPGQTCILAIMSVKRADLRL